MMPNIPADHLEYLERRPFAFRCSTAVFPPEEIEALAIYGNWLEALAESAIQPVTAEQERFLLVDREQAEPQTVCERAWLRLKGRREYEAEQGNRTSEVEDYGIIEWDRERCWW